MDRQLIIKLQPPPSGGLLNLADAMQQVIDFVRVLEEAEKGLGEPKRFEWKLEKAATNSPLTVVARAESLDPTVDVTPYVRRVKAEVSQGFRSLISRREPPSWMTPQTIGIVRSLLTRTQNGIGRTEIDFETDTAAPDVLSIDRAQATEGLHAIEAISAIDVAELPARTAFGEVEGVMVAAGRYYNRPAIQIKTELYGFAWCVLSEAIMKRFGDETKISDVWTGKTIGVEGRLLYAEGGKLSRVEASDLREIKAAPPVDLDSILDPHFTSGMDPAEYLRKFHDGELG